MLTFKKFNESYEIYRKFSVFFIKFRIKFDKRVLDEISD